MRLGILSDTHDQVERARTAIGLLRNAGAEALVHCGDLASPPVVELLADLPSCFVFGNHDADAAPQLARTAAGCGVACLGWSGTVEFVGKRVGVVHGHMRSDVRRVLATAPAYLLSGHSHVASDEVAGGVRRINPGALHRADSFTVALLDVESGALKFVRVS